jgi:hypothetical protein
MKRFVEGEDRRQGVLLPEYLDDYVSEDNPVRVISFTAFRASPSAIKRLATRVLHIRSSDPRGFLARQSGP